MIEIDFIRADIFEEVLNYMYTARISVKKKDVNLMMSSGQILGIRFLDKLCSQVNTPVYICTGDFYTPVYICRQKKTDLFFLQKRDVSDDKEKFPYDIVKLALPPEAQLPPDSEVTSPESHLYLTCVSLVSQPEPPLSLPRVSPVSHLSLP